MGHVPPFRDMKKKRDERVSKKQLQSDCGGQHGRKGLENKAGRQRTALEELGLQLARTWGAAHWPC